MGKINLSKIAKNLQTAIAKHSPEILTGIGITGMITTTVLAVRATPKAMKLIEAEKERQNREIIDEAVKNGQDICNQITKLDPLSVIKTTWKCYIPTIVTGVTSTACLIGASAVNVKRNAALATAYTLSETALREYQEKVVETIGEKKEQAVREAIAKDDVDRHPVTNREVIITNKGNTLCYDVHSDRYFRSDIEKLRQIVNDLNRQMLSDMYISLNDFYYEIGLTRTEMGDELGWNIDQGFIDLDFSSHLSSDGEPCLAIKYSIAPKYGYSKLA